MEDIAFDVICRIPLLSNQEIRRLLASESRHYEITKSLVNLLYNIVTVGSVPTTRLQKEYFEKYTRPVLDILSTKKPLYAKKRVFERNIDLVIRIAEACPPV
jgi:hypothetical protein